MKTMSQLNIFVRIKKHVQKIEIIDCDGQTEKIAPKGFILTTKLLKWNS